MVEFKASTIRNTKPQEYLMRFLFGGAATVLAGLVAKRFGPGVGGLFLAFPAIFPATVTLLESHEKQRMAKHGCDGTTRGRMAASIDASGTALGTIGLAAFGLVLWLLLPTESPWLVTPLAAVAWAIVAGSLWEVRHRRWFLRRHAHRPAPRKAHPSSTR